MPVKGVFDLFGTLVKHIVLFNSEIWVININKVLEFIRKYIEVIM